MKALLTLVLSHSIIANAFGDGGAGVGQSGLTPFIPLILMVGIFYFLMLRPQQRKQKVHEQFVAALKRGDMVITASGIIGTVRAVSDKFVTLEVDDGVCIKVLRTQIADNANTLREESKPKGSLLNQLQEEKK